MARRYEMYKDTEGKYAVYQQAYDRGKMQSPILNPSGIPSAHSMGVNIWGDKHALESCLRQWKGEDKGQYSLPDTGLWTWSYLKKAEEKIKAINGEFKRLKQQKINEGKRPPKEMPQELNEKMLTAEAELDIVKEEIEYLEKKIATYTTSDKKESDNKVLKHGPQGVGRLRNGLLTEVDGQVVKPDAKNILRICDPRSPYNGMMAADYFELIVRPWTRESIKQRGQYVIKSRLANKRGEPRPPVPKVPWPKMPEENVAPKRTKLN